MGVFVLSGAPSWPPVSIVWLASVVTEYTEIQTVMRADNTVLTAG